MKNLLILTIIVLLCLISTPVFSQETTPPTVVIRAYYSEPFSMARPETDILWGPAEGEFLELTVDGTILNFRHQIVRLDWKSVELSDEGIINQLYKVENSVIVIRTFLPEGLPAEKLEWSDQDGNLYEFIIKADGLGTSEWIVPEI